MSGEGESEKSWGSMGDGYHQNTLYIGMEFSNHKLKIYFKNTILGGKEKRTQPLNARWI